MPLGKNLFWSSPGLGTWKSFPFPSPRPCHLEIFFFFFFWSSPELGTWKIYPFPSPRPCYLENFCSWPLNFSIFRKSSFVALHFQVGLLNWFLFFSLKGWGFVFFSEDLLKYHFLAVNKFFMERIFFYESSKVALNGRLMARSSTKMILSWCFLQVGDLRTGILEEDDFL